MLKFFTYYFYILAILAAYGLFFQSCGMPASTGPKLVGYSGGDDCGHYLPPLFKEAICDFINGSNIPYKQIHADHCSVKFQLDTYPKEFKHWQKVARWLNRTNDFNAFLHIAPVNGNFSLVYHCQAPDPFLELNQCVNNTQVISYFDGRYLNGQKCVDYAHYLIRANVGVK